MQGRDDGGGSGEGNGDSERLRFVRSSACQRRCPSSLSHTAVPTSKPVARRRRGAVTRAHLYERAAYLTRTPHGGHSVAPSMSRARNRNIGAVFVGKVARIFELGSQL